MRKAEIGGDGVVLNVIECNPEAPPDWCVDWPEAGEAGPGWTYDGEAFHPPEEPARTLAEIEAELKLRRDAAMASGVTVGGVAVHTDDLSQQRITSAALAVTLDAGLTINWKADGGFVTLSALQITAIAQAVRAHVQACFDREAELLAALAAAEDPEQVDITTGWPGGAA